jgi:molybdopterin molybdotransferase
MLQNIDVTPVEQVCLTRSAGRVLAADIIASRTQPPFHTSAMDGYAVRARDVTPAPVTLDVVGVSVAGKRFDGAVNPGQAVRIFTGAPLPEGADTIVIQENVETIVDHGPAGGDLNRLPNRAASSARRAWIFTKVTHLLCRTGQVSDATAHACAGRRPWLRRRYRLQVQAVRPSVALLLSTGDELVEPGAAVRP